MYEFKQNQLKRKINKKQFILKHTGKKSLFTQTS